MDSRESPGGDHNKSQPTAKTPNLDAKGSNLNQRMMVDYSNLTRTFRDFHIKLKPRSLSKAARNDPRSVRTWEEVLCGISEARANPDGGGDEENVHPTRTEGTQEHGSMKEAVTENHGDDDNQEKERNQDGGSSADDDNEDSEYDEYDDNNDDEDEEDASSEYDENNEFEWLEPIDVEVTSTSDLDQSDKPKILAFCQSKLIRRGQMRDNFYAEIEQPSRETSMLGFDLFDRYGRLRSEFKTHPIMKGTGVWTQELDHGDILLIEELFVHKPYRRQRLGQKMIEALLALVTQKTRSFFTFTWPTMFHVYDIAQEWDSLHDDAAKEMMQDREDSCAIAFWRSLGFRRVGSTIWFAMTPDLEHPSQKLISSDDFDPPKAPVTSLHPLLRSLEQIDDPPLPNFGTTSYLSPRSNPGRTPDFLNVLQNCMQENGPTGTCWTSQDKNGNTVLHLAAATSNAACIEWILKQAFGILLLQSRNHRGQTPLEMLEVMLEKLRTQKTFNLLTIHMSDKFQGYSESTVRCLIMLKGFGDPEQFMKSKGLNAVLQIHGGCTCGQCLEGFLSPRMLDALITQAELGYDMLDSDVKDAIGLDWVEWHIDSLGYVPLKVLINLRTSKSMRQGFANLWEHIATCLKKGSVPTEQRILDVVRGAGEWPPATRSFLERGGTVESAFLAICRNAMEQDEVTGDGSYQDTFSEQIAKLPECRNDLEFGFVSGSCGYRRISLVRNVDPWGDPLDEDGNVVDSMM